MSRERADLRRIREMLTAYMVLVPLMPLIGEAIEAEQEAPGYGAKAVMFDQLAALNACRQA